MAPINAKSLVKDRPTRAAFLTAALFVVVAAISFKWLLPSPAPQYTTAKVARGDVESTVLAAGVLQPIRQVDVGTRVTGQLKSLKVKPGDHVRMGDLLAEIDPIVAENELRSAQARLADLEAQKRSAIAKLWRSKLEWDRQRGLINGSATSRRDLESAEAQSLADEASLAALDAQIAQAKSQLDIARANLSYTKITAPIEGEVVDVLLEQGQTVVAAQIVPVILKLAQLDAMTVRTQVPEADVINVRVGQPVSFTIMGDPDTRHSGTLRMVALAPQRPSEPAQASSSGQQSTLSSGTTGAVFYNALFDVPNPGRRLRIGMTAQVSIAIGVSKGALTIPASVLREEGSDGRYKLRVVDAGGQVTTKLVTIGVNNHVVAEVLDGLNEGDLVIIGEASPSSTSAPGPRQ